MPVLQNEVDLEFNRVKSLNQFQLEYDKLQNEFENLTKLAANIAGTEVSMINLIDNYTQWSISCYGMHNSQTPREDSICQYTIKEQDYLEIPSIKDDARSNTKNVGDLKYYIGFPLITESGSKLGALCILGKQEKTLEENKIIQLKLIAKEIVEKLALKRDLKKARNLVTDAIQTQKKLAHDFRGPLNGILGVTNLAAEEEQLNLRESKSYLKMIGKSSTALLNLASEILMSENINKEIISQISFEELGERVKELYLPQAVIKNISLEVKYDAVDAQTLVVKENLLQIAGNLISNAIKFSPKNEKVVLYLALDKDASILSLHVIDSGNGFSAEKIQNIIDGKAISTIGSAGEIGYGLGLKVVKHLVDTRKGNLKISSVPGEGSKFVVELPQL